MKYAPPALPRLPALNLFQGRLLFRALAVGVTLVFLCPPAQAQPRPDSVKADTAQTKTRKKDPFAACLFSAFLPGSGQFYTGGRRKGIFLFGTFATGMALVVRYPLHSKESDIGSYLAAGSYWYSLVDAPVSAVLFNRKKVELTKGTDGVGLVLLPDPRDPRRLRPGVGLRAGF